jgi:hypothetical protein
VLSYLLEVISGSAVFTTSSKRATQLVQIVAFDESLPAKTLKRKHAKLSKDHPPSEVRKTT